MKRVKIILRNSFVSQFVSSILFIAFVFTPGLLLSKKLKSNHAFPISEIKITAADATANHWFGSAVAISDSFAVVGTQNDDDNGKDAGAVYVFRLSEDGTWSQGAKLLASDGGPNDWFGHNVSISGDYILIGAPSDDDNGPASGAAYVFKREGETWIEQAKLLSEDLAAEDFFGVSCSISGDYALVGAVYDDNEKGADAGAAYIFKRTGDIWAQEAKLVAADGRANHDFGWKVSLSGDYAIVGVPHDDEKSQAAGAAYIFRHDGSNWLQEAKLTASDAQAVSLFGDAVSISGDDAIIGAYGDDENGDESGAAYIFHRNSVGWSEEIKLTQKDAAEFDNFGRLFVSISGKYAIVGARSDDDNGDDSGSAYIFRSEAHKWVELAKLVASDGAANDAFGYSVALSGEHAIVGALWDDDGGNNSGSAYIYTGFTNPIPNLIATELSVQGEHFLAGDSLLISGTVANVGDSTTGSAFHMDFYLSTDVHQPDFKLFVGTALLSPLPADSSRPFSFIRKIPKTTPSDYYYVWALLDPLDAVAESVEDDNRIHTPQRLAIGDVMPGPNLVGSRLTFAPDSLGTGDLLTIDGTVKNTGDQSTGSAFTVNYFLSADDTANVDVDLGSFVIGEVGAGDSLQFSNTVKVPRTTVPGHYYVWMRVDFLNNIAESNENDNLFQSKTRLNVTPKTFQVGDENWDDCFGKGLQLSVDGDVTDIIVYHGNVYVCGTLTQAGDVEVNYIAKWTGDGWQALGSGLNSSGQSMFVHGNALYVLGSFTEAGGVPAEKLAKWDENSWSSAPFTAADIHGTLSSIAFGDSSDIFISGDFEDVAGVIVNDVARWDGTNWRALGGGFPTNFTQIFSIVFYHGELFAGGTQDGFGILAKWDGTQWVNIGADETVGKLVVKGNYLYVLGGFEFVNGIQNMFGIAKWDGQQWFPVGGGIFPTSQDVDDVDVLGNSEIVVGWFDKQGAINIGRATGPQGWSTLGSGVGSYQQGDIVRAVAVLGNDVFVGGTFETAGNIPSHNFAIWHEPGVVQPVLTITSPDSNSVWQTDTDQAIQWDSNAGGAVRIWLYKGNTFVKSIADSTSNDGNRIWSVDAELSSASDYRIRITSLSDSTLDAFSDFFTIDNVTSAHENGSQAPEQFALLQNYPNPFNPETVISYQIPKFQFVTIKIYNLDGQEVATLVHKRQNAGAYRAVWNGLDSAGQKAASGVYLYRLTTEAFVQTRKMILLR